MGLEQVSRLDASSFEAHFGALPTSWRAACHTAPFGAASVSFSDPASMVSALANVLDHPHLLMSPDVLSALEQTVVRAGDSSPTIAVMQLFALSRVVRARFEASAGDGRQPTRQVRLGEDLDVALGAMVSVVLDELEQKGGSDPIYQPRPKPARKFAPNGEPARELRYGNRAAAAIEQAKGLIAEYLGVGIAEAVVILRESSRRREQSIRIIAAALVERTLTVDQLAPDRPDAGAVGDNAYRVT